jgi:hypothetical protein
MMSKDPAIRSRRESGERCGDGGERCGDGGMHLMGVRAELETTSKNESENETENGHFRIN